MLLRVYCTDIPPLRLNVVDTERDESKKIVLSKELAWLEVWSHGSKLLGSNLRWSLLHDARSPDMRH